MRKLPSPQKVDRLYWLEEWTQSKIAKKFKCASQCVSRFMRRHSLKTRNHKKRNQVECAVEGCEEPTCRIKRWRHGEFHFIWTNHCATHHHLNVRRWNRELRRRQRGSIRRQECPNKGLELGQLSSIAREDDGTGTAGRRPVD